MAVVEIDKLTKDYEVGFVRKRKVRALDGLSLTVNQGEIFGLLGANGAGKTTTLKLLMTLIFPTAGNAQILGHNIADVSIHSRIGYLPENPYFYDYLSAFEFLDFCGQIFGFSRAERNSRAKELLSRVKLDESKWNTQLRKFSKGMLQRWFAQALLTIPQLFFLTSQEWLIRWPARGARLIAALRQRARQSSCVHIFVPTSRYCVSCAIRKAADWLLGSLEDLRKDS